MGDTPRPRLIVRENGLEQIVDLDQRETHIGRSKENDIEINDVSSSRKHCRIVRTGSHYVLEDLQSRNGTLINGILIRKQELQSGDKVEIGKTQLFFDRVPMTQLRSADTATDTLLLSTEYFLEPLTELNETSQLELLQREREIFLRLFDISKTLSGQRELGPLLATILDTVLEITGAERGFILLADDGELKVKASRNVDHEAVRKAELKVSHSISHRVLETGRPILIGDARADSRTREFTSVVDLKLESVLCCPMSVRGAVQGVIYVDNRFENEAFQRAQLRFVEFLADQAGIFIENARLFEDLEARQRELRRAKEEAEDLNRQFQEMLVSRDSQLLEVTNAISQTQEKRFKHDYSSIITKSPKMHRIFEVLDRVIDTDMPVLVMGESGTGKELIAQAVHYQGRRASKPFVSQNCAAIPPNLLESEFFGHVRGAFTGAVSNKKGLFEHANGGTLFLDEIGDMSLDLQTKLLRVLEDGKIRPVGGRDFVKVDVRVISATNRPLAEMIRSNEFREDLYYRLNVISVTLPPLRDRREDIAPLVDFILTRTSEKAKRAKPEVDPQALYQLYQYSWPGNVRELINEVERLFTLSEGDVITPEHLSPQILRSEAREVRNQGSLKEIVSDAVEGLERELIVRALTEESWNKSKTSKRLGVSRPTLDQKIEKYDIQRPPKAGK